MKRPSSRSTGDDSSSGSRRGGLLSFGRALAVMFLALGVNGVLAGSIPRYDPTWVDVLAVAVVAWFEGFFPAVIAGAFAIVAYQLWFSTTPSNARDLLIPSRPSFLVIAVVTAIRLLTNSRRAVAKEKPDLAGADATSLSDPHPLFTRELEPTPRREEEATPVQSDEIVRLREGLALTELDRDGLQSNMQNAMLRHQEESSRLKVDRARAVEEARAAREALSSTKETISVLEGELAEARRSAADSQRLAEERSAAMLDGEARRGTDETTLRDALEKEKERVQRAATKIDSLATELARSTVERDRWQRTTTELRQDAQRRIQELSDQSTRASAAAMTAGQELEQERRRSALADKRIAQLETIIARAGEEVVAARKVADHAATERDQLTRDLDAAARDLNHWQREYSRAADDSAHATAALTELSLVQSELAQVQLEHARVSGLLEAATSEADRLRNQHAEVASDLAATTETVTALKAVKGEAEEVRAENVRLQSLLQTARDEAERAAATNASLEGRVAGLAPLQSEVERLDRAHAEAIRLLDDARAEADRARQDGEGVARELTRATAAIAELSATQSEAEELRAVAANLGQRDAENIALKSTLERLQAETMTLVRAVESSTEERDAAQARAALAADEIAAASRTLAELEETRASADRLRSENRRLTGALGAAGREAARLQADSTHYADEVIGLRSRLERVSAASAESESLRAEVARLVRELGEARSQNDTLSQHRAMLDETAASEKASLQAELDREGDIRRQTLVDAERLTSEINAHKQESERWRAEAERLVAGKEAVAQSAVEESARVVEEQRRVREDLEAEWAATLEESASVSAEREREIAERDVRLAEASRRLEDATERIEQLEDALATAQATFDDAARLRETMTGAVAASASAAAARVVELERDVTRLRTSLLDAGREATEARAMFEEQRSTLAEAEKTWDEKLLRIVEGMTTDHENDLGEAMMERETAKAELRVATSQIARLEASLRAAQTARDEVEQEWKRRGEQVLTAIVQRETTIRSAAEQEVARLRVELGLLTEAHQKAEAAAVDQRRQHEEAEGSWGTKLQKIVANVTDDYEADLGEAITSREAARAEARSIANDLRKAQQKVMAAEETQRALVAEAARLEAEIARLSDAALPSTSTVGAGADGRVLQKKLQQAEEINSAWGDAFAEREVELRRESERQMTELQSQLDKVRHSEAALTEGFRAAAADAGALRRRLGEERHAAELAAAERDEAFRQGMLHAQQQWEDRFDTVVSEGQQKLESLRAQLHEQEGELAALRARDVEEHARREQAGTEEARIARQIELMRQTDDERRTRSEVLQFAEDARSLLMGASPRPSVPPAERDPFPGATADSRSPGSSESSTASEDFLAIVTRLGGDT